MPKTPLKGLNKLPVEDLRQIARFNRIIKNYEKMLRIEKRHSNSKSASPL